MEGEGGGEGGSLGEREASLPQSSISSILSCDL